MLELSEKMKEHFRNDGGENPYQICETICNACGVRITKLPALPEKVLAGLKAKAMDKPARSKTCPYQLRELFYRKA